MDKLQHQQFNDGVLSVYAVENIAEPGDKPKNGLNINKPSIRYEERTVGMNRFWAAKQDQTTISRILRIPRINGISKHDIAIPIDEEQYDIIQIQFINDVVPPSLDLSLEKVSVKYDIKGY